MRRLLRRVPFARLARLAGYVALFSLPVAIASCSGANTETTFGCTCTPVVDPVCGSDGITYENGCSAECAGAKIAQAGVCTEDAGPCSCSTTSDPVCGGNGVTYENACEATCAQQTIAYAGFCGTLPDADTSPDGGTFPGSCSTQSCGTNQVCVDDGCTVSTCTEADDGGACPLGWSFDPNSSCWPIGLPPGSPGSCTRACPTTSHQCVDVSATSCNPPTCSCLPADICEVAGGDCEDVVNGIVECVSEGPGPL